MKRIVVITGGFPSISQTFVMREVSAMREAGWAVHVIAPSSGTKADWEQGHQFNITCEDVTYLDWRGCRPSIPWISENQAKLKEAADITRYGRILGARRITFFDRLRKHAHCKEADLIHCHFVQWAYEVGIGLSLVLDRPMTVTAHDSFLPDHPTGLLDRVQRTARGVACVCREWVRLWEERTGHGDRLAWVPNGVNLGEFPAPDRQEGGIAKIISISNCVNHKRMDDLIRAMKILDGRGLDFRFVYIGGGPLEQRIRGLVNELGLRGRVRLLGAQPHERVRGELASSDLFALASERESFGVVTAEAMASGLPTVVSRTAGAKDLVVEGETGFLFEVGDVMALADHLDRLIRDQPLRLQMGRAARARIQSDFSWENHMNSMTRLWLRAMEVS